MAWSSSPGPDRLRGQDVGTRMMAEAESEARRRRCRAIVLYTISFQAPGFYEKLGYRVFGLGGLRPAGDEPYLHGERPETPHLSAREAER